LNILLTYFKKSRLPHSDNKESNRYELIGNSLAIHDTHVNKAVHFFSDEKLTKKKVLSDS